MESVIRVSLRRGQLGQALERLRSPGLIADVLAQLQPFAQCCLSILVAPFRCSHQPDAIQRPG